MQELLSFVNHLADEAGTVVRQYFRSSFAIESKADETPVTIADRTVEARLREIIEKERPQDGILGEEYGPKESRNGYTWVLDPIDGTKSFTIGRPSFGTLIALCKNDVPVLGVIDQPILKERWIGDGKQTTFNGTPVRTSSCPSLKKMKVASTSPSQLAPPFIPPQAGGKERSDKGGDHLWQRLYQECAYVIWGGDCYSYGLLANGWLDCVIESGLQPYDFAAIVPVVTGAGGWMGDWQGNPLTLQSEGKTLALGDADRKEEFLSLLKT
jgi:inositol-phosphate phosphatase/L-galactose 1-phosphate phosphatase/histidinol-phosphatase